MSAPKRLKRYFPLLRAIAAMRNKKAQRLVLKQLKKYPPFVVTLKEIAENTIKQNITLTEEQKKKLEKHAAVVISLRRKRKVEQSGGFLGVVVPILASAIAGLLNEQS